MNFPGGVWPVMLTPFNNTGQVDDEALRNLVNWYIGQGVNGLFAVCQSSEMFFLNPTERLHVASVVVEAAAGRVPVIASGHVSEAISDQIREISEMMKTGVDAVILITNRLAREEESDEIWMENCRQIISWVDDRVPLGMYECPYPYKRILSLENLKTCADTGRFYFLKDTCCDAGLIRQRLEIIKGSRLKLYNANTTTLLDSLKSGAAGYSGVMANFHPALYTYLCEHCRENGREIGFLQEFLTLSSLIERQCYPVNAKYYLQEYEKLGVTTVCRSQEDRLLTETFKTEVGVLHAMTRQYEDRYIGFY